MRVYRLPWIVCPALASVIGLAGAPVAICGDGVELNQLEKLVAKDGASSDRFGRSVSANDEFLAISATASNELALGSGSVHVFDTTTGNFIRKILPLVDNQIPSSFGRGVSVWENLLAATEVGRYPNFGSVYIFDLATGEQLMRIHQPDGTEFDLFGGSVALHGDRLVVGAPDSGESFSRSGAAYLFDASSGELIRKLVPEDVDPGDYFGTAIAITEDYVVIGSPGDGDIAAWSGSAYLFDARTGDEIMKLVPSDGYTAFDFGESVAAEGGLAVIGAPGKTETLHGQGGAYLFDLQTGEQLGAWLASDAAEFDRFGGAVALSDSHAVIGARGSNVLGPNLNRAYVFDVRTGEEIATLFPKNGEAHEAFGASVTMTKSRAVVGVPGDDGVVENTGSAFLFDLSSLFGCPGDVNDDGLINLADLNIVLANFGTMGEIGDATGDGLVNLADLNTVLANFGGACE